MIGRPGILLIGPRSLRENPSEILRALGATTMIGYTFINPFGAFHRCAPDVRRQQLYYFCKSITRYVLLKMLSLERPNRFGLFTGGPQVGPSRPLSKYKYCAGPRAICPRLLPPAGSDCCPPNLSTLSQSAHDLSGSLCLQSRSLCLCRSGLLSYI